MINISQLLGLLIRLFATICAILNPVSLGLDVEVLEFDDELVDSAFICHWSLWTEYGCRFDNTVCQAELTRKCLCLKFSQIRRNSFPEYNTRTCKYGTLQSDKDRPDGRCDTNCQLLDAFFRRLEGMDGAWCPWSSWKDDTCTKSLQGFLEGYQHSFRKCECPPVWLEGSSCHGADTRTTNCRESNTNVSSWILTIWDSIFADSVVAFSIPLFLIIWFCCLVRPLRQGVQFGRLQSAVVSAELTALREQRKRCRGSPRMGRTGRSRISQRRSRKSTRLVESEDK